PAVGGRRPGGRYSLFDVQADRGGHADPGHRQGPAGARGPRLLGAAPDRADLPRRPGPAVRRRHQRDPEDRDRPRHPGEGPMSDYRGQVAVITGASRGIGQALALNLARGGASVVINYKKNAYLSEKTRDGDENARGA